MPDKRDMHKAKSKRNHQKPAPERHTGDASHPATREPYGGASAQATDRSAGATAMTAPAGKAEHARGGELAGTMAGNMAGTMAGNMAGTMAGNMAGNVAGDRADRAGNAPGRPAGRGKKNRSAH